MKISYDPKKLVPNFFIEEGDLVELDGIHRMMKSKPWNDLQKYWAIGREAILQGMKESNRTVAGSKLATNKISAYDGYDTCLSVPESIIRQAQELIEAQKEAKHAAATDFSTSDDE